MKAVERFCNRISVGNIPEDEAVARVAFDRIQILRIPGVGERIKVHYWLLMMLKPLENEV